MSVGSYRTNISMSDFESVRDFSASNSAKEIQETPVGGDGEWLTPAQPRGQEQPEIPHKSPTNSHCPLPNTFFSPPAEFITTKDTQESAADTTKAKRVSGGRREATELGDVATALQSVPKGLCPPRGFIYTQVLSTLPGSSPRGWVSPLS